MSSTVEGNLDEVQSFLGQEFKRQKINERHFELVNNNCVLSFYFDRHDVSKVVILVSDALSQNEGMKFLILRHLLHAKERLQTGQSRFEFIGRTLANDFQSILNGDFSIRKEYEQVESKFFDRIDDVMSLPPDAPARQMFDDCDIRWLDEVGV